MIDRCILPINPMDPTAAQMFHPVSEALPHVLPVCDGLLMGLQKWARPGPGPHTVPFSTPASEQTRNNLKGFNSFHLEATRPESGLQCLACAMFSRQRPPVKGHILSCATLHLCRLLSFPTRAKPKHCEPREALRGGISLSFLEPSCCSWCHFVGIHCQKLKCSLVNRLLRYPHEGPCVAHPAAECSLPLVPDQPEHFTQVNCP